MLILIQTHLHIAQLLSRFRFWQVSPSELRKANQNLTEKGRTTPTAHEVTASGLTAQTWDPSLERTEKQAAMLPFEGWHILPEDSGFFPLEGKEKIPDWKCLTATISTTSTFKLGPILSLLPLLTTIPIPGQSSLSQFTCGNIACFTSWRLFAVCVSPSSQL